MTEKAENIPSWGKGLIAGLVITLCVQAYAYFNLKERMERSESLVIVNTADIAEKLRTGQSELSAKEVSERVQIIVDELASNGKVVIRGEAIWAAPDHLKMDFVE